MKKLLVLLVLISGVVVHSQTSNVPSSPAFSILNYEPSAVLRPTSYKEFSADILNSFDQEGKLLMNLGLEVSPYWLQSNPELTRETYLNPNVWQSVKQTFTISGATVKDTISKSNNLGFGLRTQIIQGKVTAKYQEKYAELNQYETLIGMIESVKIVILPTDTLKSPDDILNTIVKMATDEGLPENIINSVIKKGESIKSANGDLESLKKFCTDLSNSIDNSINGLTNEVIALQKKRTGFSLEVASAAKFISTTESKNSLDKIGFWATANNYISDTDAFTLTARLMSNVKDSLTVNTDIGLGYIKEGKKYNISLEAMIRWYKAELPALNNLNEPVTIVEKEFTYRLATQLSYCFNENISFNLSLGKDFNDPKISGTSFFSIFGLQYSLFDKLSSVVK